MFLSPFSNFSRTSEPHFPLLFLPRGRPLHSTFVQYTTSRETTASECGVHSPASVTPSVKAAVWGGCRPRAANSALEAALVIERPSMKKSEIKPLVREVGTLAAARQCWHLADINGGCSNATIRSHQNYESATLTRITASSTTTKPQQIFTHRPALAVLLLRLSLPVFPHRHPYPYRFPARVLSPWTFSMIR